MLIVSTWAELDIMEYTSTIVIEIHKKPAKIRVGTHRIVHFIDLNHYDTFLKNAKQTIEIIPTNNTLLPLLNHELTQATELIESIKPLIPSNRQTRSIDALGTIWKYIAGTPDREDFEIVTQNMNSLNKNNNKQTVINSKLNIQINKLITITNTLTNQIKKSNNIEIEVLLNLQTKIRLIKEEIINIKYALQYAKLNILNSMLLNKEEIKIALEDFKNDNIPFKTIEEVLELSKIAVLYNNLNLLYIIKIPITTATIYENILLRPVKRSNKIVKLPFDEIIKFKNETYGVKTKSNNYNSINVYEKNSLVDISESTCIPKIISSLDSSCDFTTAYHVPEIELISQGLILLNDFSDAITINGKNKTLNGTFVIKFDNETILIKNTNFSNYETLHWNTKPAVYQPTPLEKQNIKLLSLESLEQLHLNNTEQIAMLRTTTNIVGISSTSITLVVIAILIAMKCLHKEKVMIAIQEVAKPNPEFHTNAPLWSSPQTRGGRVI